MRGHSFAAWTALLLGVTALPAQEADVTWLSTELPVPPAHILVEARTEQRSYTMMFDTGCGLTIISPDHPELLHRPRDANTLTDANGRTVPLQMFEGVPMTLQKLALPNRVVGGMDLKPFAAALGRQLDGAVGMLELKQEKLLFDYRRRQLVIHRGPWRLNGAGVKEIAVREMRSGPMFDAEIGGHPRSLSIDSGSNACITLKSSFFDMLVSEGVIVRRKPTGWDIALTGKVETQAGRFVKGDLMGKSLVGVDVCSGDTQESGVIGLAWMCGFSMEIALGEDAMRYVAIPDARPPINVAAMTGVGFRYASGKPAVLLLYPGGPAERAGLAVGDVIEQFGDLPAREINDPRLIVFCEQYAGKPIALKYTRKADGRTVNGSLQLRKRLDFWHVAEW